MIDTIKTIAGKIAIGKRMKWRQWNGDGGFVSRSGGENPGIRQNGKKRNKQQGCLLNFWQNMLQ